MALVKLGSVQSVTPVVSGYVNLATDCSTSILPVANGGSGSGSFTDGQLLIGNTTGNTLAKATLTGTANQVIVTNGHGSITLSLPQDIGTSSTPTFSTLTLSGQLDTPSIVHAGTISITPTSGNDVDINTAAGAYLHVTSTLGGGIKLERSTVNDAGTSLVFDTGGSNKWALGPQGDGTENFKLFNTTTTGTAFSVDNATNVMNIAALTATNAVFTTPNIGTPSAGVLTSCTGLPLTTGITGTLGVANGGTGQTTYTNGQLLIGNTTGNTLTKSTLTGTTNQVSVTNGAGSITLSLPQNIHTGASPTFTGLTLSSTITNACTTQLVMDFSRSGAGALEGRWFNAATTTTTAYTALNFGELYGTKQGTMYYVNASYTPNGRYQPNQLLIECLTSGGMLAFSYPSAGTFQVFAQTGTPVLHADGSGNFTIGAATHSLGKVESRSTSSSQFASSYDASNYGTWQVGSTGVNTFTATGSGASFSFANSITMADAKDITVGSTTGTKIATSTTQKLGFYSATPIVQRSGAAQAAVATTAATQTTPWGYSTQAQADAIITLLNELRAWAVAQGFIKGSA